MYGYNLISMKIRKTVNSWRSSNHLGRKIGYLDFDELIKVGLSSCEEKPSGKRLKMWHKSPYLSTFVHIFKQ